jgi:hypothetical protein
MGGGKKIAEKLDSWAHQEFNKPETKTQTRLRILYFKEKNILVEKV